MTISEISRIPSMLELEVIILKLSALRPREVK